MSPRGKHPQVTFKSKCGLSPIFSYLVQISFFLISSEQSPMNVAHYFKIKILTKHLSASWILIRKDLCEEQQAAKNVPISGWMITGANKMCLNWMALNLKLECWDTQRYSGINRHIYSSVLRYSLPLHSTILAENPLPTFPIICLMRGPKFCFETAENWNWRDYCHFRFTSTAFQNTPNFLNRHPQPHKAPSPEALVTHQSHDSVRTIPALVFSISTWTLRNS